MSKITRCSTFVVVCRLKSYTHTVTFEGSELCLPEYPRVKVLFPQNAVEKKEEVQVIVKVRARRLDDISGSFGFSLWL